MTNRRFDAYFSSDGGHTWDKARASGWPISESILGGEKEEDYGFVIALTSGDTMIDIGISEKQLRLMQKDADKLKASNERIRRTERIPINPADSGTEDQS